MRPIAAAFPWPGVPLLVPALFAALVACAGSTPGRDATGADTAASAGAPRRGVWVFLVSAPGAGELPPDDLAAAMRGHFANMDRLIEAGQLWIAGPLGEPRADPRHRGVFVLDAASIAEGLALAGSDPAVVAGVFELDAHTFTTEAAMEAIVALDREQQARREAARPGEEVPWVGRRYVLARHPRGPSADALVASLQGSGRALFAGQLDDAEWLVCLDAEEALEARAALVSAGAGKQAGAWTLMGWYASTGLTDLPAASR